VVRFGSRIPDRTNRRNGYRVLERDTRAGTIELAIPKPGGELSPRVATGASEAYPEGADISGRHELSAGVVDAAEKKLVEQLDITRPSMPQASC
jgi:putative transposase